MRDLHDSHISGTHSYKAGLDWNRRKECKAESLSKRISGTSTSAPSGTSVVDIYIYMDERGDGGDRVEMTDVVLLLLLLFALLLGY